MLRASLIVLTFAATTVLVLDEPDASSEVAAPAVVDRPNEVADEIDDSLAKIRNIVSERLVGCYVCGKNGGGCSILPCRIDDKGTAGFRFRNEPPMGWTAIMQLDPEDPFTLIMVDRRNWGDLTASIVLVPSGVLITWSDGVTWSSLR